MKDGSNSGSSGSYNSLTTFDWDYDNLNNKPSKLTDFSNDLVIDYSGTGITNKPDTTAWDKNASGYSKPQWYFSLGPDW